MYAILKAQSLQTGISRKGHGIETMNTNTTLVIMAAGLGSRFGGDKQIMSVGPSNEMLMEYTIHDASAAGFNKIVFILKGNMIDTVRTACGEKLSHRVEVCYAEQSYADIPAWYHIPAERVKPFGTVHAVLSARKYVNEPFAVLNADDYYGAEAFRTMHNTLLSLHEGEGAMVAYRLGNTLSDNGTVTRGVCRRGEDGFLVGVNECHNLAANEEGTVTDGETGKRYAPDTPVSMNFWGFLPSIFDEMQTYFEDFLRTLAPTEIKGECLLPVMVNDFLVAGKLRVRMDTTNDAWFGMTYREDYDLICAKLRELVKMGIYPVNLRA